jgi:hypothetical protein
MIENSKKINAEGGEQEGNKEVDLDVSMNSELTTKDAEIELELKMGTL